MFTSCLIPWVVTFEALCIYDGVIQGLKCVRIFVLSTVVGFNIKTATIRKWVLFPPCSQDMKTEYSAAPALWDITDYSPYTM
jgi:hypothetical protein